ncbi:MAG: pimeloyl-[acyl-carrier protein] methyl ester esterase [Methylococcaceae bacterium]|nr:MAG: pimeloyl-[acyl-carrier protein] methyl ester esterase [Methylococcaceae bacterium]
MMQGLYTETVGQGPDLLLVHGWGMHGGVWGKFVELLARRFRVRLVDLPGHGHSPMPSGQAWVDAVLDAAPPIAHWLGWSLGAQIALHAAAVRPERVKSLSMLCGNPCFAERSDWPTAMAPALLEGFRASVESSGVGALPRFLALQAQGLPQPRSLLKRMQGLLGQRPAPARQALLAGLQLLHSYDLRAALTELQCPVLALLGANDALVPVALGEALRQLKPDLRLEVLAGSAHQPFFSHPMECAGLVEAFLLAHDGD